MTAADPRPPMKKLPLLAWGFVLFGTLRIGASILSLPFVRRPRKDVPDQ